MKIFTFLSLFLIPLYTNAATLNFTYSPDPVNLTSSLGNPFILTPSPGVGSISYNTTGDSVSRLEATEFALNLFVPQIDLFGNPVEFEVFLTLDDLKELRISKINNEIVEFSLLAETDYLFDPADLDPFDQTINLQFRINQDSSATVTQTGEFLTSDILDSTGTITIPEPSSSSLFFLTTIFALFHRSR